MRVLTLLKTGFFAVLLLNISIVNAAVKIGPQGMDFYNPPASLKQGKPGDLIWIQKISSDAPNSIAWKILYWSSTIDNTIIPVSGILIAPIGKAATTGRPVVSWAHGTSGIARNCAPSLVDNPAQDAKFYYMPNCSAEFDCGVPGLNEMIAAGYVVVATDYNGLGAAGIHQYLIGQTEAQNALDAAVAAQKIPLANAGKQVIVMGWSQGGQAAVWSAELADYIKDSATVVGAVALAPVNGVEQIKIMNAMIAAGKTLPPVSSAEQMMAWYAMTVAFPELKLSDVLTPEGIEFFKESSKSQCNHHMANALTYMVDTLGVIAVRKDPANQDLWMKRYEQNSLGTIQAKVPLAVFQGDQDTAVFPAATQEYVTQACSAGTAIYYQEYTGVDHIRLSATAQPDFLKWIADRFAGKPAPSNCSK